MQLFHVDMQYQIFLPVESNTKVSMRENIYLLFILFYFIDKHLLFFPNKNPNMNLTKDLKKKNEESKKIVKLSWPILAKYLTSFSFCFGFR